MLEPVPVEPHAVLDNLPPWNGREFERFKTDLMIEAAKKAFLRMFPAGIDDPGFLAEEIGYKRAASERYERLFMPRAEQWVRDGNASEIATTLNQVYGRDLNNGLRLNLLFARAEEPAYFDALQAGETVTVKLAEALLALLKSETQADMERYIAAVSALPQREGGSPSFTWPTVTWLPFIAAPNRHMFVKPTIIQAFASASAREIGYQSLPNVRSYAGILGFAESFRRTLEASEVNVSGRELDMIDTQSFMWVVDRYNAADVAKAGAGGDQRENG